MNIWKSCLEQLHIKQTLYCNWKYLNLLKQKSRCISTFLEHLLSYNFMPKITLPTRITEETATLIGNILINNDVLNCIYGDITTSISDHLP